VLEGDLSSQASIRAFAAAVLHDHPRLDILLNNAGVWVSERRTTVDGLELTWATNVVGYYLLTECLLPGLERAGGARVVNVASRMAGQLDCGDPNFERRRYQSLRAYNQSKQANRQWTWELARRLADRRITANALHPGAVRSQIQRDAKAWLKPFLQIGNLFMLTPVAGADTAVWLSASPEVAGKTGGFYHRRREISCRFRNLDEERTLWQLLEQQTGRSLATAA
jgi:NAD(P)-dependent dehydrogenase (short-subunit alcohol dehydrogenase family)